MDSVIDTRTEQKIHVKNIDKKETKNYELQ